MSEGAENKFPFQVEGRALESPRKILTAAEILELAREKGILAGAPPAKELTLKGKHAVYAGNDAVDLSKDNDFSLGRAYKFKVNGQEMESKFEKLTALDIIEMAGKEGVSIPGCKTEDLLLEAVGGEKPYQFKLDEWVDLGQFHEFLFILNKPTPVA